MADAPVAPVSTVVIRVRLRQLGAAEEWPGKPRLDRPDPAFIWPADHA